MWVQTIQVVGYKDVEMTNYLWITIILDDST